MDRQEFNAKLERLTRWNFQNSSRFRVQFPSILDLTAGVAIGDDHAITGLAVYVIPKDTYKDEKEEEEIKMELLASLERFFSRSHDIKIIICKLHPSFVGRKDESAVSYQNFEIVASK
jgi:hypothetical protein